MVIASSCSEPSGATGNDLNKSAARPVWLRMNGRDVLSWLLALAVVGAIVAGAFVTLAALRPEAVEFEAPEVTSVAWGESIARDVGLLLRG